MSVNELYASLDTNVVNHLIVEINLGLGSLRGRVTAIVASNECRVS